uniref:EDR1/CTR1/ARMC3-like peptidase-like domain-containing protein n=1 Tax=Eptatretus burgeri TaxID=7764 RepID=A0A8C4RAI5_EPTBU
MKCQMSQLLFCFFIWLLGWFMHPQFDTVFIECRNAQTLVLMLQSTEVSIVMKACEAIFKFAEKCDENIKQLLALGAINPLVSLLSHEDQFIRRNAIMALGELSSNGLLTVLISLLTCSSDPLRLSSCQALASLTKGHRENCSLAVNGTTSLLELLKSLACLVVPATTVLCNMCMNEGPRTCLQEKGAISALLACLVSTDPEIQTSVLQALAALVCDSKSRAELRAADRLPLIINLLNSEYKEVYFAACWTVSSCAADESTVQEFCKLGVLQILHKLNLSKSRCSHFNETVYTKLLAKNLPAKYSFTGHLSSCDFVLDGFYDVGKLRPDTQLPSLEELIRMPLNVHRPTLLINAAPCADDSLSKSKEEENVQQWPKLGVSQTNSYQWLPPTDPILQGYINETHTMVQPSMSMQEQIVILARFVSNKMGGAVTRLNEFSWELHCSKLKEELNSNVIPIGKIQKGIYYHRALLFKVLADKLAICSTLVRGSYGRAWNEVLLRQDSTTCCQSLPETSSKFIVDLMYNPGDLLVANGRNSYSYCRF